MERAKNQSVGDGEIAKQLPRRAYTLQEVSEMLQEPVSTIRTHCQTQALRGAYKTGGKTSPWRVPMKAIDYYQATRPNQ